MERSQFTFYDSYFKSVSRIKKKSARADAYDAICKYALCGVEPNLDSMEDAAAIAFLGAKPNIDAGRRKAESGCKGGTSKESASKQQANGKQSESKNKNKDKKKNKNKNKCYNTREEMNLAFDQFWTVYPKKVGKTDARKAFARVEIPIETLISAVQRQKESTQWTKDGGQFVPNPSTWLNQGRWEDELPVAGNSGVPKGASGTLGEAELYSIRKALSDMEADQ